MQSSTDINRRLPQLAISTDSGCVYIVERDGLYKVGFTRNDPVQRARRVRGRLLFTIRTGQHPAALEHAIHKRFMAQSVSKPDFKREWFSLTPEELDDLRQFATALSTS